MQTAKVFKSGNSLVAIREMSQTLARAFELLTQMPKDFFADGRKDTPSQERD